jgi:hypothetical protein
MRGLLLSTCCLLAACLPSRAADVSLVFSHGNCQQVDTGVHRIDYATLARLRGAQLIDLEPAPSEEGELALVAVTIGTVPTLGYRLVPVHDRVEGEVLTLRIAVEAPPPDAVVAQMLSRPCLVFGVSADRYRQVRFEDSAGGTIGEVDLSALSD